ncbi:MAG TPA: glycoside hydrolase [Oceanospirillales bacterium]|nr:glycoside hydrolase [Oceanospirillaceae bacterium]HBS43142.1 glycoside hydrolase [Oceanospirillales bacterium]|tara:strand:+ start:41736 stop:42965 length:1230 start_codon:yes stop_codon:yes gene_type:complete
MTETTQRICIVTETYAPEVNGVAHTLSMLVSGMLQRGIHVQIIRPRQNKEDTGGNSRHESGLLSELTLPGLPMPGYPELRFGLPSKRKVRNTLEAFRPDAIYVATEGPLGWAACRTAHRLGIPVVSGFHTNFHQYGKHYGAGLLEALGYRYMRWFHNQTSATLVPTAQQAAELNEHGFERVSVMSRGVDSHQFSPARRSAELRRQWGVKDDDLVLLYVGRIAAEKNMQLVLKTWQHLKGSNSRIRLVLVGNGPELDNIRTRHPDVICAGVKRGEELATYYASGDIFLFPSLTDTFGNVVTEALASGLALVSFDYAAAHEHTEHNHSAMLAPFGDEAAFLRAAATLQERPNLLSQIRHAARDIAQGISWDSIVDEFLQHLYSARALRVTHGTKQTSSGKSRVSVQKSRSV